ncbi:MAG: HD domain-containing protein [Ruminococcaceae bacterium]|nr:HD domain-containing protein [Oscillospiraceae bacterium]
MQDILKDFAASEKNPKWQDIIKRETPLYHQEGDMRSHFLRDYTRIIHSSAYKRLRNKTQVFFSPQSDHICTRIEHVNHVESISYTIAKYLGLNTELTRAISVAHDLGHAPFGHKGEKFLSEISKREIGEPFWHERNGLIAVDETELLEDYEKCRRNLNLTYAVRDGIISHCGEVSDEGILPRETPIDLKKEFDSPSKFQPFTFEGCVVKISDRISYMGRDIIDAMDLAILPREKFVELEEELSEVLGKKINNTILINHFINDVCENSDSEKGIAFSPEIKNAIDILNDFNLKNIYRCKRVEYSDNYFKLVINQIFDLLAGAFDGNGTFKKLDEIAVFYPEIIRRFTSWLIGYTKHRGEEYKNKVIFDLNDEKDYKRAIITYISGMTDKFAIETYNDIISF